MGIAKVEGEAEGSDDQIDELRKPRRDERSTHQRGLRKQPWKAPPSGRHEKREADNGKDNAKNQKQKNRALVRHNCRGKGHPARLCLTPADHSTQAVDEEGDTDEGSSDEGSSSGNVNSMVQATTTMTSWDWGVSPQNKASESVCRYVQSCETQRNSQV